MSRRIPRNQGSSETEDPVHAAIEAKRRRIADLVKAAAAAVPPGVTTVIADTPAKPNTGSSSGFAAPPPPPGFTAKASGESQAGSPKQDSPSSSPSGSGGLLAALLGYSEDSEDSDGPESPRAATSQSGKASLGSMQEQQQQEAKAAVDPPASSGEANQDNLDQELANFMSQLESSGLLREEQDAAAAAAVVEPAGAQQAQGATEAGAPGEKPAGKDAGASEPAPEGEAGAEAEQKLLGYLAQAPDWSKVLDMGGGGVYYWNLSTNEVVWEVPEGLDPNQLLPPEAEPSAGGERQEQPGTKAEADASEAGWGATQAGLGDGSCPQAAGPDGAAPQVGASAGQSGEGEGEGKGLGVEQRPVLEMGGVPAGAGPEGMGAGGDAAVEGLEEGELEEGQLPPEPEQHEAGSLVAEGKQQQPAQEDQGADGAKASGSDTPALGSALKEEPHAAPDRDALAQQLLTKPQDHVTAVLESLASDAAEAARCFMGSLPRAVRLAVEAEVRHSDWLELSAAQREAATQGRADKGFSWERYELHVAAKAMAALSALPAARREAAVVMAGGAEQAAATGVAAAAAAASTNSGAQRTGKAAREDETRSTTPPLSGGAMGGPSEPLEHPAAHGVAALKAGVAARGRSPGPVGLQRDSAPGPLPPGYGPYADYHSMHGGYNWQLHAHHYAAMQPYGYMSHPHPYPYGGHGPGAPLFPVVPGPEHSTPAWPAAAAAHGRESPPPLPPSKAEPGEDAEQPPAPPLPPDAPPPPPLDDDAPPGMPSHPPPPDSPVNPPPPSEPAPPLPPDPSPPLPDSAATDQDMELEPPGDGPGGYLNQALQAPEAISYANQMLAAAAATEKPALSSDRRKEYRAQPTPSVPAPAPAPAPAPLAVAAPQAATPVAAAADKKRKAEKPGSEATGATKKVKSKKELGSKVASLMNQWSSVRRSLEEEEEREARKEQEAFDPEVQQRRKLSEIEQWKAEQLRSGQAEENANFQPLQGDWRKRFGAKGSDTSKKSSKKDKAEASAASAALKYPRRSDTRPDLEGLSQGLPSGWKALWKADTGDIYYENKSTKVRVWRGWAVDSVIRLQV